MIHGVQGLNRLAGEEGVWSWLTRQDDHASSTATTVRMSASHQFI